MDQYPGNSIVSKQSTDAGQKDDTPARKKIVEGKVTRRRKPLGARLKEMFISGEESFVETLVEDVVIPTLKELILTMVDQSARGFKEGLEERLYPSGRRPNSGYRTGGPIAYHNRYSSPTRVSTYRSRESNTSYHRPLVRRSNRVMDILVEHREDGDRVIEELQAMIDSENFATVGDFYSMVGEKPNATDEEWGWDDLSTARVKRVEDGYLICMPRPIPIDRR